MHHGKEYPFPYGHVKKPLNIKYTNRSYLGNNTHIEGLKFDSIFESGNLDCAIQVIFI
jgi:hypothetical protein